MPQIVERDKVEELFRRAEVKSFLNGWNDNKAVLIFEYRQITYRIEMEMPIKEDFKKTEGGRYRKNENTVFEAWAASCREAWKDLYALVSTKLVFVLKGRATIEQEFLAYMVTAQGEVAGDFLIPQISTIANGEGIQHQIPSKIE